jgi:histidinol-phosphate aminotransferase
LDANENPYPLPPELLGEVLAAVEQVPLHRYPDPLAEELRGLLARALGISVSQLILGNGSDELIQLLFMATGPGKEVLSPVPTFAMYQVLSHAQGLSFIGVPLASDYTLNVEGFAAALKRERPQVIVFAYPNNPTGNCFAEAAIEASLEQREILVVVDEAYYDFSRKSFLPRLSRHPNLVILRSLSKVGLAGLRLGMLITHEELTRELGKIRLPYNVNSLSQAVATVILRHRDVLEKQVEEIIAEREWLSRELQSLPGLRPFPSDANFLLFRAEGRSEVIFQHLMKAGIVIRSFGQTPLLEDCLRVTVGQPHENRLFLDSLREVLG